MSFYEALNVLSSAETVTEFERTTSLRGNAHSRSQLGPADPSVYWYPDDTTHRRDRSYWERLYTLSHREFWRMLEASTRMTSYLYTYNEPLNATTGNLFVFADDNDRVIGWMYDNTLVGHEREAMPR